MIKLERELMRSVCNDPNIIEFIGSYYDPNAQDAKGQE